MPSENDWRRSSSLSQEEWDAIYRTKPMPAIRTGEDWADCPNCIGGVTTTNLGPLTISGKCCVCCGTGRVLAVEKEFMVAKEKAK